MAHNFLGHKYAHNRNFFAQEHVRHHATTSYFAPGYKKALAAVAVTTAVAPVACAVAGPRKGLAYTLGFVGTYLGYELLHRRAHTHPPTGAYSRWVRKHHFHHHFHSPNMNHGVTSPIWDHVFGTHEEPSIVRVPEKHAMDWLVDPETGDVRAEFSDDYAIARKGKRSRPPAAMSTGAEPIRAA